MIEKGKTIIFCRFFSVLAVLSLVMAGGFYAHAGEISPAGHTHSLSHYNHTDHGHSGVPENHKSESGSLHCGSNILALFHECEIALLVEANKPALFLSVAEVSHHPVPEPPPPRSF
ncbi:hypothetical protein HPQ64_13965 [Rhizobiales bacterium]|uniref:hypothetical protein n=1 Tax=Hongsoonwoonella zoysiae TaxID=2821844 RepID=UPI001560DA99|nr:hypothetical protein [Hongsoonwoonella zoysiae]NRG18794.1 hypothetical protein [Hongsoonwoonella zoysiae]